MRILKLTLTILAFASQAFSATYYVESKGSEAANMADEVVTVGATAWSNATSISTPCSAKTAMVHAIAGDVVNLRGGTYVVTQAAAYHAALEPTNSGSAGNPITFQAYTGESPIIDVNLTGESHYGIGTGGQDWIIWDGFEVYGNGGTHMGGCMVGCDSASTNLIIRNCIFHGGTHKITHNDNAELLRIEKTSYATIQDCLMYNARQVNEVHNTSALKAYDNYHLIIENCEVYNTTNAIYLKRLNPGAIVRNNWIHDNGIGIYVAVYLSNSTDGCKIYNNVISNSERTSYYGEASESATANNYQFYSNTIYAPNDTGVSYAKGSGWDIYNNIIVWNGSGSHALWIYKGSSLNTCDHNQWGAASFSIRDEDTEQTYTSLPSWEASTVLIGGSSPGTGDLTSNPLFVNSSGSMSRLADFALSSKSPCIGAGRNSSNIGADVSLVGTGAESGEDPPAPSGTATIRASGTAGWR